MPRQPSCPKDTQEPGQKGREDCPPRAQCQLSSGAPGKSCSLHYPSSHRQATNTSIPPATSGRATRCALSVVTQQLLPVRKTHCLEQREIFKRFPGSFLPTVVCCCLLRRLENLVFLGSCGRARKPESPIPISSTVSFRDKNWVTSCLCASALPQKNMS